LLQHLQHLQEKKSTNIVITFLVFCASIPGISAVPSCPPHNQTLVVSRADFWTREIHQTQQHQMKDFSRPFAFHHHQPNHPHYHPAFSTKMAMEHCTI